MSITFPFILDGATGTELQKRGFNGDTATETWVLEHPDKLKEIQAGYAAAGSNVVYAPTFAANRLKLKEHAIDMPVSELVPKLVEISREAVGGKSMVAGDLSPLGKFLPPIGDMSFEEMYDVYLEQVKSLEEAGVDFYAVETLMSVPEAKAAVLAIKEVSDKPIFVTFTCDVNGKTMTGTDVCAALVIFQDLGVDAFGLNCSTGPKEMAKQFERLKEFAAIPLIAKPNAGLPKVKDGKTYYDCTPEDFVAYVKEMAACGVKIFGGCCGTTPEHIKALSEAVKDLEMADPAPSHEDEIVLATEKEVFVLSKEDLKDICPVEITEDFEDDLSDALEEDNALLGIEIKSEEYIKILEETQYLITKPVCVKAASEELLNAALRVYQGKAIY
ncbi:MAG: homocysteine S-methyltransferase family protein [Lachnospiraceae bacterium]|nr:homocysteine S-methyltransferase family protein [Lachnospiraceae bacterium]